ncbi:unnamed protein product [Rangifer tarandus platyrhynchus]|uniref:Uncharacterized protein n=2 Tax=Rangifer tarandus platyrhynchus TaxID=3082113 RepID=A0ABN8YME1_RANTA|nr:unnamed protein product [Rangifer tarandus platyrhynchus]CAI9701400.1 unnamed protein product [Rangifer tarandus platyrhynchus]
MYVLGAKKLVIQWNKVRAEITVRSGVPAGPWDQGLRTWIVRGLAPLRSAHQRVEGGEKVLSVGAQAGEPERLGKGWLRVSEAKREKWDSVGRREAPARGGSAAAPPGQLLLTEVRGSLAGLGGPGEMGLVPSAPQRRRRGGDRREGRGGAGARAAGGGGRGRQGGDRRSEGAYRALPKPCV